MIKEERSSEAVVIWFPDASKALSSTVVGGGLRRIRAAIIRHVDDILPDDDPTAIAEEAAREAGIDPGQAAVFLTAADLRKAYASARKGDVFVAASLGLEPLACPGATGSPGAGAGTINTVVYVGKCLEDPALVELAHLAGAVKASALASMGLSCGGVRAFGTVTDAVLVASRDCGGVAYAGPATEHGAAVAALLFETLIRLGKTEPGMWLKRLTGIDADELADLVIKAYRLAPVPGIPEESVRSTVGRILKEELSDPNLWALLIAASEVDAHAAAGTVPDLSREEHAADTPRIVVDELIGASIATYVNGWRALLAYMWLDRIKSRAFPELAALPMFKDDAVAALVGAVLSRVLDNLVGGRS